MIPLVRLRYIQGLAAVHEELHRPREVDLTTDGQSLIVAPAGSGRPLVKVPLAAVEPVRVEPNAGPTTAASKAAAGLTGTEQVLVMRCRPAPGVAAAVAGQPIVFALPRHADLAMTVKAVVEVLLPRTAEEMARLARGGRRRSQLVAVSFLGTVALSLVLIVLALMTVFARRQREGAISDRQVPVAYTRLAAGADLAAWAESVAWIRIG